MAVTRPSVRSIKTFSWRGAPQEFSNRYYFNGAAPVDATAWHAFMDAVVAMEQNILSSDATIIQLHGYLPPSDVAVASKSYSTPGVLSSGVAVPGECAALLRHGTNKRSSKNHPVYLFSYFHCAHRGATRDELDAGTKAAMEAFGNAWVSGVTTGGVTRIRSTPDGSPAIGARVDEWITHRDFPG